MKYKLKEIKKTQVDIEYQEEVFDLTVESNHSYCVGDNIIVHNCGFPQLSATIDCSETAHKHGIFICSDGGIKQTGDFAKAFCAGADFVMAGSIFTSKDCDGIVEEKDGISKVRIFGMSSEYANTKFYGGLSDYKASEGDCRIVETSKTFKEIISDIMGGLRSCGSYINAISIKDFPKEATFVRVNNLK